jgi:hypothetical protein
MAFFNEISGVQEHISGALVCRQNISGAVVCNQSQCANVTSFLNQL